METILLIQPLLYCPDSFVSLYYTGCVTTLQPLVGNDSSTLFTKTLVRKTMRLTEF